MTFTCKKANNSHVFINTFFYGRTIKIAFSFVCSIVQSRKKFQLTKIEKYKVCKGLFLQSFILLNLSLISRLIAGCVTCYLVLSFDGNRRHEENFNLLQKLSPKSVRAKSVFEMRLYHNR